MTLFNKYLQFAFNALKEANTKVGDNEMSDTFDNLSKFTEDITKLPNEDDVLNVIINWNSNTDKYKRYLRYVLGDLKESK